MGSWDELFVQIGLECAEELLAEHRQRIHESIEANQAVVKLKDVFDELTKRTRQRVRDYVKCARGEALGQVLRSDLVQQVAAFSGDEDDVVLPAPYLQIPEMVCNALYREQWEAYRPTHEELFEHMINDNIKELAVKIEEASKFGGKQVLFKICCSRDRKTGTGCDRKPGWFGMPRLNDSYAPSMPTWVQKDEANQFTAEVLAQKVADRFVRSGYKVCVEGQCFELKLHVQWN
eukprot:TRINITY_DN2132_c0_g5_i1.p1 TRINITY_DN2132_c0_g5~~TRINITY_DN2132_c0_g5_i1.p1  ORF type:complete len:233 (+),score=25.84 TRINITY_DN2132_c0_g5_i1:456-1154(+)